MVGCRRMGNSFGLVFSLDCSFCRISHLSSDFWSMQMLTILHGTIKVWLAVLGWVMHQDCSFQRSIFLQNFTIIILFLEYADTCEGAEAMGWNHFFICLLFFWCFCAHVSTWFDYGFLRCLLMIFIWWWFFFYKPGFCWVSRACDLMMIFFKSSFVF